MRRNAENNEPSTQFRRFTDRPSAPLIDYIASQCRLHSHNSLLSWVNGLSSWLLFRLKSNPWELPLKWSCLGFGFRWLLDSRHFGRLASGQLPPPSPPPNYKLRWEAARRLSEGGPRSRTRWDQEIRIAFPQRHSVIPSKLGGQVSKVFNFVSMNLRTCDGTLKRK